MDRRESMADPVTTRVVLAVAKEKGVDPLSLPPLYDAIDPDALDSLFDSSTADGRNQTPPEVRFSYAGWDVLVRDGEVTVEQACLHSETRCD